MAKAAAPYLHPRLSSVEHTGHAEEFRKAADMTDDELAAIAAGAKLTVVKGWRVSPALACIHHNDITGLDGMKS